VKEGRNPRDEGNDVWEGSLNGGEGSDNFRESNKGTGE